MKELYKSVVLGIVTILVWVLASVVFNTPKQVAKDFATIENNKEKEISFIETLTMNYKDATNTQSYNR